MKEITISTDFIKLDSFLKFCQIAESGGMAKVMVKDGIVKVNGEVCLQRGKKLYKDAIVEVAIFDDLKGKKEIFKFKVV